MSFLRSTLYLLLLFITVVPYSIVVVLGAPLPRLWRYYLICGWQRIALCLARYVLGIRYEVHGRENIPDTPLVILSKHQSAWETLAYASLFRPHVYVMKRELLWIPFLGWGLTMMSPIAINRANRKAAMSQLIEQGIERLRQGFSIMIFPEGTRIPVGKRGIYRRGGAVLAVNTGVDVLPIAHNAGLLWPRNAFIKKSGTITIVIGPVIRSAGRSADEVMRETENWIEEQMRYLTPGPITPIPLATPSL